MKRTVALGDRELSLQRRRVDHDRLLAAEELLELGLGSRVHRHDLGPAPQTRIRHRDLAALFQRERGGNGEYLDVAMFDATVAFMASAVVPYLVTGRALERTGNTGHRGQPTSALFMARDSRRLSLGVVQQHQFEQLARLLERPEWLADARFADPDARRVNAGRPAGGAVGGA